MSLFGFLRSVWRRVPVPIRIVTARIGILRVGRAVARPSHDDLYDRGYFDYIESTAASSAPAIVESLARDIAPKTVLDVGCGTGAILHECMRRGIRGRGLEYSEAAIAYCHERGIDVERFDLETDRLPPPD